MFVSEVDKEVLISIIVTSQIHWLFKMAAVLKYCTVFGCFRFESNALRNTLIFYFKFNSEIGYKVIVFELLEII